jgi:hypothetical protein
MAGMDSQHIRCSRAKPGGSVRLRPTCRQRCIQLNITNKRSKIPAREKGRASRGGNAADLMAAGRLGPRLVGPKACWTQGLRAGALEGPRHRLALTEVDG